MRVALVHDWITGIRGGEKVLEVLCEQHPDAELFTLVSVPGAGTPPIERLPRHTSFVQRLPGVFLEVDPREADRDNAIA